MHTTINSNETLVTLLPSAVERHGDRVAVSHRDGTGWRDVSYAEVGKVVTALALGLIELGYRPVERVAILADHATGVDLRGLRDLDGGRRRRPRLPDQLPGGMRMGSR